MAGHTSRAFGVKGQLKVDWNNGKAPVPSGEGRIYLKSGENGNFEKFTLLKDHRHGSRNVITLKEIGSRTDAEKYKCSEIWIEENALPALQEDEYYTYQLIEMRVETIEGEYLGEIKDIFATGSNDVYVVKKGDEEILVPAIQDVVKNIDLNERLIKIELIEGLR